MEKKNWENFNSALFLKAFDLYKEVKGYVENYRDSSHLSISFKLDEVNYDIVYKLKDEHIDYCNSICSCGEDDCVHRYVGGLIFATKKANRFTLNEVQAFSYEMSKTNGDVAKKILSFLFDDRYFTLSDFIKYKEKAVDFVKNRDSNLINIGKEHLEDLFDEVYEQYERTSDTLELIEMKLPVLSDSYSEKNLFKYTDDKELLTNLSKRCVEKCLEYISGIYEKVGDMYYASIIDFLFVLMKDHVKFANDIEPYFISFYSGDTKIKEYKLASIKIEMQKDTNKGNELYLNALKMLSDKIIEISKY